VPSFKWIFGFYKCTVNCGLPDQIKAYREGMFSVELFIRHIVVLSTVCAATKNPYLLEVIPVPICI
jgi:hypothetical protein